MLLLCEDDEPIRKVMERLIGPLCPVRVAATAAEALQLAAQESFQGIVTDLHGVNGLAVVEVARARDPLVPVLIISGTAEPADFHAAYALNVHILTKPVDPGDLVAFVMRCCHGGVVADWTERYGLTTSEAGILELVDGGHHRCELAQLRGVAEGTIKKQVASLLSKTGDDNLIALRMRLVLDRK